MDFTIAGARRSRYSDARGDPTTERTAAAPTRLAPRTLCACIFDVDGVLLASPHERAWRDALDGFADPGRFTTAMYQAEVAGKPRLAGARAALEALGVADAAHQAVLYADRKQQRLEALIRAGGVAAFPDALRFVSALEALGWPMAVASSSKNALEMLEPIRLDSGKRFLDAFGASVCGRDFPRGKPDPEIFLVAAYELGAEPEHCFVVEDAPVGIEAARAGHMGTLGVARLDDASGLRAADADLVVVSLDDVSLERLAESELASLERPG